MSHHEVQVWRTTRLARIGGGALAFAVSAYCGTAFVVGMMNDRTAAADLAIVAFIVVAAPVIAWAAAFRPRIELTDDEVKVVGVFGTRQVGLSEIERAVAGYSGLTIYRHLGKPVGVWAVQKSNLAGWLRWHTRADDVADAINSAAQQAQSRSFV